MIHANHHNFSQSTDIAIQNIFGFLYNKELMQKHLLCDKVEPSKVESCMAVSAWTNLWHQDLISEYSQDLAYWAHEYYTGHIITS